MAETKVNLANIAVILVEPIYGGNVGACARAMANMGLNELILVRPGDVFTKEAAWMATSAYQLVDRAKIYERLQDAVSNSQITVGTTRRFGRFRKPDMTPRKMAEILGPLTQNNRMALIFGSEDKGLSTEDLMLCQHIVSIPSSEKYPSLNLAQSVMVLCYELFLEAALQDTSDARKLASSESLEKFFELLAFLLERIGTFTKRSPKSMMYLLRKIFMRAALDERDVRILIGIFKDFNHLVNRLALGRVAADEIDQLVRSGGLEDRNR